MLARAVLSPLVPHSKIKDAVRLNAHRTLGASMYARLAILFCECDGKKLSLNALVTAALQPMPSKVQARLRERSSDCGDSIGDRKLMSAEPAGVLNRGEGGSDTPPHSHLPLDTVIALSCL